MSEIIIPSLGFDSAKELFEYDCNTGNIYWRKTRTKRIKPGDLAGSNLKGYRRVRVDKNFIYCHRLVWFLHHGYWSSKYIDHINGNKADNRIENLRECTKQENGYNRKPQTCLSGIKGVKFITKTNKFVARIFIDKKEKHLGTFDTLEEAAICRKNAEVIYHKEFAFDNPKCS